MFEVHQVHNMQEPPLIANIYLTGESPVAAIQQRTAVEKVQLWLLH